MKIERNGRFALQEVRKLDASPGWIIGCTQIVTKVQWHCSLPIAHMLNDLMIQEPRMTLATRNQSKFEHLMIILLGRVHVPQNAVM